MATVNKLPWLCEKVYWKEKDVSVIQWCPGHPVESAFTQKPLQGGWGGGEEALCSKVYTHTQRPPGYLLSQLTFMQATHSWPINHHMLRPTPPPTPTPPHTYRNSDSTWNCHSCLLRLCLMLKYSMYLHTHKNLFENEMNCLLNVSCGFISLLVAFFFLHENVPNFPK